MEYLLQNRSHGSWCTIFALCNALRYFGKPSPEPNSKEWNRLVDISLAWHGTPINKKELCKQLRVKMVPIKVEDTKNNIPVLLTVYNPQSFGCSFHATLVIDLKDNVATLVNHHWETGPVVEDIEFNKIDMPPLGDINRRAWAIKQKNHLL